jgi:serine/threonine protein kinase
MNGALEIGTILHGKNASYALDGVLGRGGFGITYSATDNDGARYAIKEFFPKTIASRTQGCDDVVIDIDKIDTTDKLRHRFVRECENIMKCEQPNIVRIIESIAANGTNYIVMELVAGRTLKEIINQDGKIGEALSLKIIKQVAQALSYLHAKHITHLDVKPDNIIYDITTGRAVLIDFGLSRQYNDDGTSDSTLLRAVSAGYAAFEQYGTSANHFTPESDVYSLGATLYKMITGETPLDAVSRLDNPSLKIPANISKTTATAIAAAISGVQRKDRIKTVKTFVDILNGKIKTTDIKKIIKEEKPDAVKPDPNPDPNPNPDRKKKHSPMNILSNLIFLAVIAVVSSFAIINIDTPTHGFSQYFFYMRNSAFIPASVIIAAAALCFMMISRRAVGFKFILSLVTAAIAAALIINFMLG